MARNSVPIRTPLPSRLGPHATLRCVDTALAIASKRDGRRYSERAIPAEAVERILNMGRLAGSARNRQPWRFVVVATPAIRERLAEAVYVPENVLAASLVVAVATSARAPAPLDCGRAAQNMMLAAWNEGIASCPNGLTDADRAARVLALGADWTVQIVVTFGYPPTEADPSRRTLEEWSGSARRLPLEEVVVTV